MEKQEFRKAIKAKLREIPEDIWSTKSRNLSTRIKDFLTKDLSTIHIEYLGGFMNLSDEPFWYLELADFEDRFCFPGATSDGMGFFHVPIGELKETTEFGVKVKTPDPNSKQVTPEVLLIPGLGFTKEGGRLGRGKGYYDKYLENYNGIKIGIGFEEQLVDELPLEKHDIHLDGIITDENSYLLKKF